MKADFEELTPEILLNSVERSLKRNLTGLTSPLPSYINRVYELEAEDGERLIAKFFRPGRWTKGALIDEQNFVKDCFDDEIPVIPPMELFDGELINDANGIFFSVMPKRFGREIEINEDDDYIRLGTLLGRIHIAGLKREAKERVSLHPLKSTKKDVDYLLDNFVPEDFKNAFELTCNSIIDLSVPLFENISFQRIHGDCHQKNILNRPGEGMMIIDFDDMMVGPSVHDMWLLLPDHANNSRHEINLILSGYETFKEFDDREIRLIEPLRAMRMIYYLAWCAKQASDYRFKTTFPQWGSLGFWNNEITDLARQLEVIKNHLNL